MRDLTSWGRFGTASLQLFLEGAVLHRTEREEGRIATWVPRSYLMSLRVLLSHTAAQYSVVEKTKEKAVVRRTRALAPHGAAVPTPAQHFFTHLLWIRDISFLYAKQSVSTFR